MRTSRFAIVLAGIVACSEPPASSDTPAVAPAAPNAVDTAAAPPAASPTAVPTADTSSDACGQIIVVAFKGALQAAETVTRDKPQAQARARELLTQLSGGADFAELARKESDAPKSAARGGVMGTFTKSEWPDLHKALRDPVFSVPVGAVAPEVIEAEYGYTLLRRCPVEKARSRHLLVRYRGAKKADGDVKRTKDQAKAYAAQCLARLEKGEDFAVVARECSDDASRERGGDIGSVGRGLLAVPYEEALFALKPGERTAVIESELGFHVIERLPD
jgi:hypothetical protein